MQGLSNRTPVRRTISSPVPSEKEEGTAEFRTLILRYAVQKNDWKTVFQMIYLKIQKKDWKENVGCSCKYPLSPKRVINLHVNAIENLPCEDKHVPGVSGEEAVGIVLYHINALCKAYQEDMQYRCNKDATFKITFIVGQHGTNALRNKLKDLFESEFFKQIFGGPILTSFSVEEEVDNNRGKIGLIIYPDSDQGEVQFSRNVVLRVDRELFPSFPSRLIQSPGCHSRESGNPGEYNGIPRSSRGMTERKIDFESVVSFPSVRV